MGTDLVQRNHQPKSLPGRLGSRVRKLILKRVSQLKSKPRLETESSTAPCHSGSSGSSIQSSPSDEQTTVRRGQHASQTTKIRPLQQTKSLMNVARKKMKRFVSRLFREYAYKSTDADNVGEKDETQSTTIFSISSKKEGITVCNVENASCSTRTAASLRAETANENLVFPESIKLESLVADDSMSVDSGFLAVSFDEDYPQLVLQPSADLESFPEIATPRTSSKPLPDLCDASKPAMPERTVDAWKKVDVNCLMSSHSPLRRKLSPISISKCMVWSDDEDDMRWSFEDNDCSQSSDDLFSVLTANEFPFDESVC